MSNAAMRVGTYTTSITPPLDIRLQGSISRNENADRVMDELSLKVLLLQSGNECFVLVTADVIEFSRKFVEELRREVDARFGIPARSIMLCPSHTHTGPPTIRLGSLRPDPDYMNLLRKKILGGIHACERNLKEARLSVGRGVCEQVGVNRRTMTERGLRQRPNPRGPKDPEVQVIRFDGTSGRPIAAIVNFGTHPTTLGVHVHQVSADYPGRMRRIVESAYGSELSVYFVQGAAGDVKAAAIGADGNFKEGEEEDIERLGRILAGEVLKVLDDCRPVEIGEIRSVLKEERFSYRRIPSREDFEELRALHQREARRWKELDEEASKGIDWEERHIDQAALHEDMVEWSEEMLAAARGTGIEERARGDLQMLMIGSNVALIGVPGELFSEVGMHLKEQTPVEFTLVCAYTNGTLGYLPSRQAIGEGGYEVEDAYKLYGFPECFHAETEAMLYREVAGLFEQLHGEAP